MKEQGFKIPEDYFESKKQSLKEIMPRQDAPARSYSRFYPWIAAAAIVIISLGIIPFLKKPQDPTLNFSDLQDEEIINFLNEDPNSLDPALFLDLNLQDSLEVSDDLDMESIESYLNEHSTEYL